MSVLRSLSVLLLAVLASACAITPAPSQGVSVAGGEREVTALTEGWQFRYDDDWTPEEAMASDDDGWEAVSLPHTWNRLGEYRIGRTEATDNRQGKGWYRLDLDASDLPDGKRQWIEFDAVGNIADLWVNDRHVGTHKGAWSRFRFDLTDYLTPGENRLLLRADNSKPEAGSSTADVIPLDGDFFIHGGIYRPARIVSVAPSHIALDDLGGPGLYATPTLEDGGSGKVAVRAKLSDATPGQSLAATLLDAGGKNVASATHALTAADASKGEATFSLSLPAPHCWNGRADPYLYSLETRLVAEGEAIDAVTVPVGFRAFAMDPDTGFSLNGQHLPLHGVSRHQDMLGKGWALSPEDHQRDMAMIAEMGANSVRFAHYQHAQDWFDLADRSGMIVWAEAPFVNKVSFDGSAASPELVANAKQQMSELIRQNYNHPSVVTWGIGNEVDLDVALNRIGIGADPVPLLKDLNALAHREDPTRPTTFADCCESTPGNKPEGLQVLTGISDLAGYNRYYGWYYGKTAELGPHLDMLHQRHPSVPLSVSEYGVGGALTQHSSAPDGGPTNSGGRPQPEEYESIWHERTWPQIRERDYLWGSWIWNMFDFSSRVRQEGDATDINTKGLVSYDRKVRKDAFFYYKAQWSDEPVVHITERRFDPRSEAETSIKVYSNAPSVTVTLNGRSLGEAPCIDRICRIEKVTLRPGANDITAAADFTSGRVEDSLRWNLIAK